MEAIFRKSFACCNCVLKSRCQGLRAGAFGDFHPRLALERRLGQAIFFRLVICSLAAGFLDWPTLRRILPPGSTPITSPDQYQWPSPHKQRIPVSHRVRVADKSFLPSAIDVSEGVGALGGLPRRRRRVEPLLLTLRVFNDIFFSGIVVCALAAIYKLLITPAIGLPRSSEGADDDIIPCTPEFQKIIVVASGAYIPCGNHSGLSWWPWSKTFRLDLSTLGQPIGQGTQQQVIRWVADVAIRPMMQGVPDTCALVACTLAVDAMHRFVYGKGRHFRWKAADPEHLFRVCKYNAIWKEGVGASIEKVLKKIQDLNGVPVVTDNPAANSASATLPLRSWKVHKLGDYDLCGVAKLLRGGPCVARLWMCPGYHSFDASLDNGSSVYRGCGRSQAAMDNGSLVYRGCGRSQAAMDECQRCYGKNVRFHAVVCFGYRRCGDQMHVLVLDNQIVTGPWRWVDVEELHALYTLYLGTMDLDKCPLLNKPENCVAYSENDLVTRATHIVEISLEKA